MKIVVAFDKFRGSLTAAAACRQVGDALRIEVPGWEVIEKPMADGGEGTAEVLCAALQGEWRNVEVTGPLPTMRVDSRYVWVGRERLAIIEMANASGLALLSPTQRDPLRTTTLGTGELIADARRRGAQRILLAIGGSATNDGGTGAAAALGWQFLDHAILPVGQGGGVLGEIARVVPPGDELPAIEVLCDVQNPLCGPNGAAAVYGPQKGATPAMVRALDDGLRHLATVVREQLGRDLAEVPGTGAAGGLGFGALAFLNARLVPGAATVMRSAGLPAALRGADWVITGEGQFDESSLAGKVAHGTVQLAHEHGVKVAVIAGTVALPELSWRAAGIDAVYALRPPEMTLEHAMTHAAGLLTDSARHCARDLALRSGK